MRKTVSYILAFLIMIDSVALIFFLTFLLTYGRESYFLSIFQSGSYVNSCVSTIKNGITDISLASGIPQKAVVGAISRDGVSAGVKSVADSYFAYINGKTASPLIHVSTKTFESRLRNSVNLYARSTKTTLTVTTKNAIDSYVKKCDGVFTANLIQLPYLNYIVNYLRKLLPLLKIMALVTGILLFMFIAISFAVGKGNALSKMLYSAYGIACAGLLVILPAVIILISGVLYHINLVSLVERESAVNLIRGGFLQALIFGVAFAALGIVGSVIASIHIKQRTVN